MISLYLMNKKGYEVLRSFCKNVGREHIDRVVSARDIGQADYFDDIKSFCEENQIPFYDRKVPQPDWKYAFAIGWRWLLPKTDGLIVLHDSPLPRYRGFNPLVSMLLNKERTLGVTALWASELADQGRIIATALVQIDYPIKVQEAIDHLIPAYCNLVNVLSRHIIAGTISDGTVQDENDATYSLWRDEQDYWIDWTKSAEDIKLHIDAVGFPYEGAKTKLDGSPGRIYDAEVVPDLRFENRCPGKIWKIENGRPIVVCGTGMLKILQDEFATDHKKLRSRFS